MGKITSFKKLVIAAIIGILFLSIAVKAQTYQDDEIKDLPGLTFTPTFKQYSGFLSTSTQSNLHYWLVEAQQNPTTSPLVLWLNGGPGCSSLSGLFQENGPFQVNPDGKTLIENMYSWNKIANVLYLEAPRDVGFSYGTPASIIHTDNLTRDDNAEAIMGFVKRFPYYAGRDFYITGESYGGVYVPTLSQKVVELIASNNLNLTFKGMAVGNGILSNSRQVDSYVDLSYYRGIIGKQQFDYLKSCCPYKLEPAQICNYTATYLDFDYTNGFYGPKNSSDPTFLACANAIAAIGQNNMWESEIYADVYNFIQSCYTSSEGFQDGLKESMKVEKVRSLLSKFTDSPIVSDGYSSFIDQGAKINTKSTDPFAGYRCYSNDAMIKYLNTAEVKKAINVPMTSPAWNITWVDCADEGFFQYLRQYPEMDGVFRSLLNRQGGTKILVYNGDTDSVCNYLGDQWFVEDLKLPSVGQRKNWHFTLQPGTTVEEVAGSQQRFSMYNSSSYIDLVTIKGSGHMVPTDRPGQSLQMMTNFIYGNSNYDTPANVSMNQAPVKDQYKSTQPMYTRKELDKVYNLPGLTFPISFDQYAGYLKASTGNYMHYWMVKSQTSPGSDPLFLWLTGGPGCSGLGALLTELGPFRPNPDNRTLSENVFSWNKFANILFLESPRGVGFSFQNMTENNDTIWDDDRSANDAYLALKDFFSVYTEFQQRPFYIIGESYGGVYVPMLTSLLIQKIQSGDIQNVNLVGMAVGNGELNSIIGSNSLLSDMYYHGYMGTGEWATLAQCCNTTYQMLPFCKFDERYYVSSDGSAYPKNPSDPCDNLIADKINNVWTDDLLLYSDVYNQNQDCYQQTSYLLGSVRSAKTRQKVVKHTRKFIKQQRDASVTTYVDAYRYNNDNYNPISTDPLGGFPCFGTDAAADYLNRPEVRKALHVPDSNTATWGFCNDNVNYNYIRQYNDTGIFFDRILMSQHPMKILIYNGDTDYACNFMGDQWFVEGIASKWGLATTKPYKEWHFRNQIAGYAKQFASQHVNINLVTVKGAGHMVPMDRPGPAMQLMSNFFNDRDFSSSVTYSTANTPLKDQYKVQEMLTNITITQKTSASRKAKAILREMNKEEAPRVKRETRADPPRPPPGSKAADKVTALPGVTFQQTNHYSGYLEAHSGVFLHYWLIETPFNQTTAPLILWLNGGPGCSSLGGLINELGPIRPSKDGKTLLENPFAWTKAGNVFFLESPRGVGFSYSSGAEVPSDAPYNDTYTAENNVLAIKAFFARYPEYNNREFYITGESYGGVYIPTLTDALIKAIKSQNINYINFKGIAIGNGEMSELLQISSAVNLLYYRGTYDYETFMQISACCPGNTTQIPGYLTPCDFTQYITLDVYGNAHGIQSDDPAIYKCGQMVEKYGFEYVWETLNDVYNTYQDCYNPPYNNTGLAKENLGKRSKRSADISSKPGQLLANKFDFVDMAKLLTKDSTDAFRGVYCYQDDASVTYLRRQDVREALHVNIPGLPDWTDCNDNINANYHQLHHDTTPVFDSILASNWPLRMLIYNGDADMACQFKGDEWFIERLAYNYQMMPVQARKPWYYKYVDDTKFDWDHRVAGFQKKFRGRNVHIDLLTVKGGGHLVPLDRPAPTLQMIYNFINNIDYDTPLPYTLIKPNDLFPNATVAPIPYDNTTYRQASKVFDLPGLTFNPTFASHSGYLSGSKQGSYIHYWFVESQNDPSNDPVVFWLTGDVGCSSVSAMLSEMGPFRPNPDGQTLYENVFSWNKQASMVFVEVPRGVGFSYQDWGDDQDTSFPDDQNAADGVAAIMNWLTIYSNFASRDIYIGGENYGGVLIPLIAKSIGAKIDSGVQPFNSIKFRGILIGNGRLSNKWNLAHRGDYMYFHGELSKEEWTTYRNCCQPQGETYCNITSYLLPNGNSNGNNAVCGRIAERIAQQRMHRSSLHLYNMYQDCYGFPVESFAHSDFHVSENNKFFKNHRFNAKAAFVSQFTRMNFKSTDSNGGFQCYMVDAVNQYLNQGSVRDALHVPDYVQQFAYCNEEVHYLYKPTYDSDYGHDMTDTFVALFNSNFIKNGDKTNPFRVMLYNGDVDLDVTILEAEYFAETLVSMLGAEKRLNRTNWNYQRPGPNSRFRVGGYTKNWYFRNQNVHLDLVTVKGAGTFVAVDRPGPALQMFSNFINNKEQGSPISVSLQRQQLNAQYQTPPNNGILPSIPTALPTTTTTTNIASTTTSTGTTTTFTGSTATNTAPTTTPNTAPTTTNTASTTTNTAPTTTPNTSPTTTNTGTTTTFTGTTTTFTGPTTTGPTTSITPSVSVSVSVSSVSPTTSGPSTTSLTSSSVSVSVSMPTVPTTTTSNPNATSSTVTPGSSTVTTKDKDGAAAAVSISLLTIFLSIFSSLFLAQRF